MCLKRAAYFKDGIENSSPANLCLVIQNDGKHWIGKER